jgi:PAS domain S-box-containing protein
MKTAGGATSTQWDLLNKAPDPMMVVDALGCLVFVNAQAEAVFGYSRSEVSGTPFEMLLPARFHSWPGRHLVPYVPTADERPTKAALELVAQHKDGHEFPVEIALSSVEDGGVMMAVATVRDITARKQAEEELRRSREDLAITLESIGDGVMVADLAGRVVRLNPAAERLTGWSQEKAIGRDVSEVFHIIDGETRAPRQSPVASVLREHTVVKPENHTILIARDGSERPIADSCAPIRTGGGELRGVVLVFRDNTVAAAEQKFFREFARVQGQLDCAPVTIVRVDRRARITHVNEAWRRFARDNGADAETVEGVGLDYVAGARRICEESAAVVADALSDMVAGRRESFTCVYPCHSPTAVRWFRLNAKRLGSDDAIVLVHTNITDHYLAEARLRVMSAVAQALAERTPLRDACRRVIAIACEGLEWAFATVWLPADGGRLRCVETWARPGFDATAFDQAMRGFAFEVSRGLPEPTSLTPSPQWFHDVTTDSNFPGSPLAATVGLRSAVSVPLTAGGEVFGVLEFFSRIQREPDPGILSLLETAGAQLGAQVLWERAERRAAEAEAAKLNVTRMLDAIVECAPAFIIAINEVGNIDFINRVLPHHKREEVIGSSWMLYVPPEEHDKSWARFRSVIETGVALTYETAVNGPDGTTLWFSTHMGPLREGDRRIGSVLVALDVTELKRTQAEFAAAQRMVAVGTLASGVAHEINTPVQFSNDSVHFLRDAARDVFGLVEKLLEVRRLAADGTPSAGLQQAIAAAVEAEEDADLAYLHDAVPKAFERCLDGLERVSTIVRSMKEFAHPSEQEMAPVDLNRAIQNTLTIARSEYKYVAELETDFGDLPPVRCHINDINQVVLNLVVNAAHAIGDVVKDSGEKGMIEVQTRQDGDQVLISVSDTGTGIPAAVGHRVFEPFFTTKEVGKGTGQGLAIAWVTVRDKHGGELSFESEVGKGTTFVIRLPIAGKRTK